MTSENSSSWVRNTELISLAISSFGIPLFFIGSGIWIIFIIQQLKNALIGYFTAFLFIFLGIIWDSNKLVGGYAFLTPLKNYLSHIESDEDRNKAKFSYFCSFGIIILVFSIIIYFIIP